jgi:hypothetical protein
MECSIRGTTGISPTKRHKSWDDEASMLRDTETRSLATQSIYTTSGRTAGSSSVRCFACDWVMRADSENEQETMM